MSSKRHSRRRSCEAKIRHITREQAEAAARSLGQRKLSQIAAYACPHCHGYHIGTVAQPNGRRTVGGGVIARAGRSWR